MSQAVDALRAHAEAPGTVLMLSGGGDAAMARRSYLALRPERVLTMDINAARRSNAPFTAPDAFFDDSDPRGFSAGRAGLWGYDLGAMTERGPQAPATLPDWPDFWAADYAGVQAFTPELARDPPARAPVGGWVRALIPAQAYEDRVQRARAYIRAGDCFQVNLSQRFDAALAEGDTPFAFFERLSAASPASHALYARLSEDQALVSNSPELFLSVEADGQVESRPIKGTRPRAATPEEDAANARALAESEKDRAENLMIVDLMRNDLSRVCAAGQVRAPRLFETQALANVHHLVSTVQGRLSPGRTAFDALYAAFPPGSVTGAPKSRALEIIAELEGEARGPYCGAFGYIDRSGEARFSVLIRTVAFYREGQSWRAQFRSGGAVTIASDPAAEYAETLHKARAIIGAFGLAEAEIPS